MNNYFKPTITALTILLVSIFIFTACIIVQTGFADKINHSDVAIILGSKANPDGTPSARLAARLDKGIELYQKGFFNKIIVSGGTGKEGVDEALVMKNYLIMHQIPVTAILVDSQGNNTDATAKNSSHIMSQMNLKSALIISQYFHIMRTRLALQQYGILPINHAHANYFEWRDLYSIPREVIAFYQYYFRRF